MFGNTFKVHSGTALRALAAAIGLSLSLVGAGGALAAGADVTNGSDSLDGQFVDWMICGWPGTFTQRGESHWTVVTADDHHRHVTYQEEVAYTVTIDDGPEVPAGLRGVTWHGHSVISYVANADPSSSREISRSVQVFFEGPFRSLSERITLHVAPDGTVLVDRDIVSVDVDCSTLG
jgi:hypothetical protein